MIYFNALYGGAQLFLLFLENIATPQNICTPPPKKFESKGIPSFIFRP